jgi:two-component system response regulator HydG
MATDKTTRRPKFSRPDGAEPTFSLVVVAGVDTGLVYTIDASGPRRTLVGTSPLCALKLRDDTVSRRHAAFTIGGDALELYDLGSTNGTTVNGVAVKEAYLQGGEAIAMGNTVFSVQRGPTELVSLAQGIGFGAAVGGSRAMRGVYPLLERLSRAAAPVLLEGEAGTGKELIAEALHLSGPRKDAPFVTLEASLLPSDSLGEILFGRPGESSLFEQARGGTLFIDELGDLPVSVQEPLRVASQQWASEVRLVAATRRDLDRDVTNKVFSEALLQAFVSGRVEIPPLRDRDGDVALLARHFWRELGGDDTDFPQDLLPRFEGYVWPGNVRELKDAVLARMSLGEFSQLKTQPKASLDVITAVLMEDLPFQRARAQVVAEFERRYMERVLAQYGGNATHAARASGIAHRYFQIVRARVK